ncbi:MAG: hypothetical protein GX219_03705 [Tissierellia bacterium]|nr:hypothetical protein [Tissierellia bacterium]
MFFIYNYSVNGIEKQKLELTTELNESIAASVEKSVRDLSMNLVGYIIGTEEAMDRRMENAAMALMEADRYSEEITLQDLERINKETNMTDMYITNPQGDFTISTERASEGFNLFDIWDGYRMLMTGEADILNSALKIKEETGEIFKFTAIPRADGKGIVQSALNAGEFEGLLNTFITSNPNINYIMIVDASGIILTSNDNTENGISAPNSAADMNQDPKVDEVFASGQPYSEITEDIYHLYIPVEKFGALQYAEDLYSEIEKFKI